MQRFRQLRALLPISIHAPRTGSDHPCASAAAALPHFNPRSPHGERRRPPAAANLSGYFNPRSPHGERRPHTISSRAPYTFQSTLPARGATAICWTSLWGWIFQSTLPARGATILRLRQHLRHRISIHAPRTGSDVFVLSQLRRLRIFQSTLPARGATFSFRRVAQLDLDFNPRSPHGERLPPTCARNLWRNFNPRSPHGERQDRAFLNRRIEISIHAPRTGSDVVS